jgi:hypothetical protein
MENEPTWLVHRRNSNFRDDGSVTFFESGEPTWVAYPLRCLQRVGCSEHEVAKTFPAVRNCYKVGQPVGVDYIHPGRGVKGYINVI